MTSPRPSSVASSSLFDLVPKSHLLKPYFTPLSDVYSFRVERLQRGPRVVWEQGIQGEADSVVEHHGGMHSGRGGEAVADVRGVVDD
ncbi:hypothetical protein OPV22_021710 [Ensete ventricosum]|uniref:HSF-type DNA-binding domain-containing protein n=1 Tax=Ensete ventricosum TaxID=4639 RepID=A0AAV8QN37_ENSVE|nr:hypothetical protein OPV22_021710 [Ensete ventricosum]